MTRDFSEIPLVDLSAMRGSQTDRARLADEVREICHSIGFFVAVNHGIDRQVTDLVFETSRRFFDLPLEQRQ